jgi:hypothetical protein
LQHHRPLLRLVVELDLANATPLRSNRLRARWQYPHQLVEYMTTSNSCVLAVLAGRALHQRQILLAPALQATAQRHYLW